MAARRQPEAESKVIDALDQLWINDEMDERFVGGHTIESI